MASGIKILVKRLSGFSGPTKRTCVLQNHYDNGDANVENGSVLCICVTIKLNTDGSANVTCELTFSRAPFNLPKTTLVIRFQIVQCSSDGINHRKAAFHFVASALRSTWKYGFSVIFHLHSLGEDYSHVNIYMSLELNLLGPLKVQLPVLSFSAPLVKDLQRGPGGEI